MEMDKSLTHINERGEMNIVDISDKVETKREALAEGYINLNKEILEKIKNQKIKKGDTVMIVEAMKTMNHVPSPIDGTVKEICVDDGQPVEFGQTIATLD